MHVPQPVAALHNSIRLRIAARYRPMTSPDAA